MIDPARFVASPLLPNETAAQAATRQNRLNALQTLMRPPFNFRFDNTRLGKVNLNSLAEFPVWAGLMQGHLNPAEFNDPDGNNSGGDEFQLSFNEFIENRRGYGPGAMVSPIYTGMPQSPPYNYDPTTLDPEYPTQFAGVYKNSFDAVYAPNLRTAANRNLARRRGVNGTLLRGGDTLAANDTPTGVTPGLQSLFVRDSTQAPNTLHQNRERNPLMRYQTLMRMPNLVSDNSQVFVIRLTMGLFEVDADDIASVGAEYKADIGDNQRYRAMFIVDRSKPVGFIQGENLNARDIVIYESYDQ